MVNNRTKGSDYEKIAAEFLLKKGLIILALNYKCKKSEIDIIAKDKDTLVFVEVKYRSSNEYGSPAASVDGRKQQKIRYAAKTYLVENNLFDEIPCRFDVVSITGKDIVWIKDAF